MFLLQQPLCFMKQFDNETHKIRLQVFLSHSGVCSRRKAMDIIKEGRVSVNGKITFEPSTPIDEKRDRVCLDNDSVKGKQYDYVLLNKPRGYVTTLKDRFADRIVSDLLPRKLKHLYPVGRLDKDTEGLLLFTNDGDLAHRMTHPRFKIDKVYDVKIRNVLKLKEKERLEKGVFLGGRKTVPCKISNVRTRNNQTFLKITIHEGRKRQIRIMFSSLGHQVVYLKREQQGCLKLGGLKLGMWRRVTAQEISNLKSEL